MKKQGIKEVRKTKKDVLETEREMGELGRFAILYARLHFILAPREREQKKRTLGNIYEVWKLTNVKIMMIAKTYFCQYLIFIPLSKSSSVDLFT